MTEPRRNAYVWNGQRWVIPPGPQPTVRTEKVLIFTSHAGWTADLLEHIAAGNIVRWA